MMSKTHYAIGLAASLSITQAQTINEFLIAVIGGTVGGVLADIDILDNDYLLDALVGQSLAICSTILILAIDFYFNFGICIYILSHKIRAILGIVSFIILILYGLSTTHRTFTHSIIGMLLFTLSLGLIYMPIIKCFLIAYLSHLVLDILNKRKLKIFFPSKFGICLGICYAGKTANKVLMYSGFVLATIFLIINLYYLL